MQDVNEIKLLLDARIPLLVIETFEEKKALDVLLKVANKHGKDLHRWSITEGLTRLNFGPQLVPKGSELNEPEEMLRHIKQQQQPAMFEARNIRLSIRAVFVTHRNVPDTKTQQRRTK